MIGRVTKRVARILLVFGISLWIAGAGCMWGCSNMAMAAESRATSTLDQHTVVVANSCHAKTHDCCAKTSGKQNSTSSTQPSFLSIFGSLPQGMMRDCPLSIRASAVVSTSKSSESASDQAQVSPAQFPSLESLEKIAVVPTVPIQFLNRGPTYLRCCVFLI
jgi:hypothetical protein